ncbi:Capsanthin/capsorubin synthase, chromoplastic [Glycine soja]|uniref:Capsanthin/capsorubin synthase, chromoplastic n=1 Tax=Glycine soja TaxID=3848 RepID=A0A445HS75_GLYSO|nr:Capsanthin/capsorubin synthase, chromoplastic [Glycine soja]
MGHYFMLFSRTASVDQASPTPHPSIPSSSNPSHSIKKTHQRRQEGTRLAEQVSLYGVKGSLVVDVSGFGSSFVAYDKVKNHGFQIAHSVLAEVDDHPFDLDKMVLVDWRDSHLGNEPYLRASSSRFPTFLYAMPFSSNLIFLEETSLDEKCLIPMGGPLPRTPQEVMAIGSTSGVVHPSTGYMVARTMAVAPVVAFAIAECLGSTRMIRGKQLSGKVLNSMWPIENRLVREFYSYGMETLLKVDLNGNRSFFDAFFDLKPYYWQGFLSSRLTLNELVWLSISLFGHASNPSRFDILTKCHVPLAKMMGNIALEYIG